MKWHIRFIENTVTSTVQLQFRILGFIWITNNYTNKYKNKKLKIKNFKTKFEALEAFKDNYNVLSYYTHASLKYYHK
jgi:hypothetical protein